MNNLIHNLLKLQTIEFDKTSQANEQEIAALRASVPPQIMGHYDRLVARGKHGVAVIRNQVCNECHMQVPRSVVLTLMRNEDIQICGNCGRYLYLLEQPVERPAAKKPRNRTKQLQPA